MHTLWGGSMIWAGVFWIVVLVAAVALVWWIARGASGAAYRDPRGRAPTAREILDERYARGEIDREEYLERRADLRGG